MADSWEDQEGGDDKSKSGFAFNPNASKFSFSPGAKSFGAPTPPAAAGSAAGPSAPKAPPPPPEPTAEEVAAKAFAADIAAEGASAVSPWSHVVLSKPILVAHATVLTDWCSSVCSRSRAMVSLHGSRVHDRSRSDLRSSRACLTTVGPQSFALVRCSQALVPSVHPACKHLK